MNRIWKNILLFLASIGPGLFLVGYNIGTGSVTTMASAGAAYGMNLTWAVLFSCAFTYFLIVIFGRYTLVTNDTPLHSFKKRFGNGISLIVLISLIFTEMVSSVGVMAIVTDIAKEWSKPLTQDGNGFNAILLTLFFAGVLIYFLFSGQYRSLEKLLAFFVAMMGTCFVLTTFMVIPEPSHVIKGLIPRIPNDANAGLIVAGMIGTTMGGILFVARSITIKEKNWDISKIKMEKRDAFISASLMFILSIAVMAAAAGTLHPLGIRVENAVDMVKTLEPLAGRFAISIFVVGIICAGLSSLFPHYILIPLLLSDYNNEKLDLNRWRNRGIVIVYALMGFIVPLFGGRPVMVMIISQALALVATPLVLILMFFLVNDKDLMGQYKAGKFTNLIIILVSVFTLLMALIGLNGMIGVF